MIYCVVCLKKAFLHIRLSPLSKITMHDPWTFTFSKDCDHLPYLYLYMILYTVFIFVCINLKQCMQKYYVSSGMVLLTVASVTALETISRRISRFNIADIILLGFIVSFEVCSSLNYWIFYHGECAKASFPRPPSLSFEYWSRVVGISPSSKNRDYPSHWLVEQQQ